MGRRYALSAEKIEEYSAETENDTFCCDPAWKKEKKTTEIRIGGAFVNINNAEKTHHDFYLIYLTNILTKVLYLTFHFEKFCYSVPTD